LHPKLFKAGIIVDEKIITEYLRRSYSAVDGLWFMMVEKEFSFDDALKIDESVWSVLPKIQSRKAKELLRLEGKGLADFLKAIEVKLESEGYGYELQLNEDSHIQIALRSCPWYDLLKKSNRQHLGPLLADRICALEFRIWLKEFGDDLRFSTGPRCCDGDSTCLLDFAKL